MHDLLIVGAGPAGSIAGLVAARAGARVRIVDRAVFPRDKLCGDTINPGALAQLRRLGVAGEIETRGAAVAGMVVTGGRGAQVVGLYPGGVYGRAMRRRDLDALLLDAAIRAGCEFEDRVLVQGAIVDHSRTGTRVGGVRVASRDGERPLTADVVIAADGRRSRLAFGLGLARHPVRPRRWAVGAYLGGVARAGPWHDQRSAGLSDPRLETRQPEERTNGQDALFGEMHVRRDCYVGVAPLPGGLTNVCVVREAAAAGTDFRDPTAILRSMIERDAILRERLDGATLVSAPVVLGPLAVDSTGASIDGLLVAGDAAGFIDPMTGDGLRFAIQGGELAAGAALRAIDRGWAGIHEALASARAGAFASKWRFNRMLRALVASPRAVGAAAMGARVVPAAFRTIIARAGDCDLAA
jgi:menaquinone-9 beta-reductase